MLAKPQWLILNCLADSDMPLEAVYAAFSEGDASRDPVDLLAVLFALYEEGLVTFRQVPIRPLGQELTERRINPSTAKEIVGDCAEDFEKFRVKR